MLGDSTGDAKMADGVPHDTILKIGFLNASVGEVSINYIMKPVSFRCFLKLLYCTNWKVENEKAEPSKARFNIFGFIYLRSGLVISLETL